MKASDSATSLTGLNPPDPACTVCGNETGRGGPEDNEALVSSKQVAICNCSFSVHPTCWNEWVTEQKEHTCPVCKKQIGRVVLPTGGAGAAPLSWWKRNGDLATLGFAIVAALILILVVTLSALRLI